ncbi:MAG: hypothetical protein ACI95C_001748 [Pseudohongiellaceae bacterium]|jgi:hypothetical protein
MKLDTIKIGYATALAFAIIWVICSLLVWGLPSMMLGMSGHMVHGDFSNMGWHMTSSGLLAGLFAWSISAGLIAALIANIYNRLV